LTFDEVPPPLPVRLGDFQLLLLGKEEDELEGSLSLEDGLSLEAWIASSMSREE